MEVKGIVAASRPRWIPVTERLPEDMPENKGKKVINCFVALKPTNGRKEQNIIKCQRRIGSYYNLEDKKVTGWMWSQGCENVVTHWMILEPPKEEAHES